MTTFYATEDLNSIPGLVVKTDGKNNKVLIEEGVKFELSQIIMAICNLWLEHSDFQSKSPASAFSIKVGM